MKTELAATALRQMEQACLTDGGHWFRTHTPGAVWCSRCGKKQEWYPITPQELNQEIKAAIDSWEGTESYLQKPLIRLRFATEALLASLQGNPVEAQDRSDGTKRYRF